MMLIVSRKDSESILISPGDDIDPKITSVEDVERVITGMEH